MKFVSDCPWTGERAASCPEGTDSRSLMNIPDWDLLDSARLVSPAAVTSEPEAGIGAFRIRWMNEEKSSASTLLSSERLALVGISFASCDPGGLWSGLPPI